MHHIIWRLNEPTEEARPRWTRVHKINELTSSTTLCGITVPDHPYDSAFDEHTPKGRAVCDRCKVSARKAAL